MRLKTRLLSFGVMAAVAATVLPAAAFASETEVGTQTLVHLDIPGGPAAAGLNALATQAGLQLFYPFDAVRGRSITPVKGDFTRDEAIQQMAAAAGLKVTHIDGQTVTLADPQSGSAAGDGADGTVQALVVTAQKREENIQDVPIAMSAFTQEDLTRSQVAGGPDLMTQVPNLTFTKTNFTSYSIQIRGIGTQAISATVDPAVAVAFNNTPFLRAHFFEQEFYDLERVEVLRGPQGTLYGRNATAGVVNLISAKPKFHFEAKASADISNYGSRRLEGMLNLPLVEDKVALRIAGAWTKRDGYTINQLSGKPIDGRDLWSTRVSLRVDPTENLRANLIWEHFEEDDDRLRSGKQTCHRATTPPTIGGVSTNVENNGVIDPRRYLNQGCVAASIYSPDAYETPDGITLAYYLPFGELGAPVHGNATWNIYASTIQSRDLRVIESQVDPTYRASSDTVELNVDYDLTPNLTLTSQTGYNRDFLFSSEDYNRFDTNPGAFIYAPPDAPECCGFGNRNHRLLPSPIGPVYGANSGKYFGLPCQDTPPADLPPYAECYTPAIFCDPQIGCSDRLVVMDLATARSRQFSQEIRVASNFEGPFNFSLGANYLRYKTLEDYYVFINAATLAVVGEGQVFYGEQPPQYGPGYDDHQCLPHGFDSVNPLIPSNPQGNLCAYIDPNPMTNLNGQGHNYFRNQNPYKVQSYAVFGEAYYDLTPELKLTAGLRWTVDKKDFHSIPSELLVTGYGYPEVAEIKQEWRKPTGRLVLTWTPHLDFTDQTMVYGSYTRGYKAGGANPPGAVLLINRGGDIPFPTHPATFNPEFVDAYELGAKNTVLGGKLTANVAGFYYDYKGYQISEIVDRSAINLNFDAKIWGAEFETDWRPLENLRFGVKLGYENTRLADDSKAVDLMDRTAGHPGWVVIKPFPTQASNCVMPDYVVATLLTINLSNEGVSNACTLSYLGRGGIPMVDPVTGFAYTPYPNTPSYWGNVPPAGYPGYDPAAGTPGDPYTGQNTFNGIDYGPAPNRGAGFDKDLSGHALPNAPKYTVTLTADYTIPLPHDWLVTLHSDFYQQSEAWTRIFNDPGYDKLKAYNNINLAAIFANEDAGWTVMAYVKNVLDKDNITGAFLNSDDTGLTTNVFLNEPRLYGLRVTKSWSDSPWWSARANHSGYYPFHVELEGYHGRAVHGHDLYQPGLYITPDHSDPFPSDLRFPVGDQSDLAASNGGGVKFIYQPDASAWSASVAFRYGRAGGGTHRTGDKDVGHDICVVNNKYCHNPSAIGPDAGKYNWHQYFESTTSSQESHTFADFTVGRDFGIGQLGGQRATSKLELGLGYARFKSNTDAIMRGSPDLYFPDNIIGAGYQFNFTHQHRINDTIRSDREFEGAGPELNWEATAPLMGGQTAGGIGVDVGVGGVVLFGKQKAQVGGHRLAYYMKGPGSPPTKYITHLYNTDIAIASREKSVTVPGVRANLGLSYSVQGVKVSGGYKVERYYKAIDGGIETRKTYDRGFDGPYMKVSIGFGG